MRRESDFPGEPKTVGELMQTAPSSASEAVARLEDIADSSMRLDGTDTAEGAQCREAAREIERLLKSLSDARTCMDRRADRIFDLSDRLVAAESRAASAEAEATSAKNAQVQIKAERDALKARLAVMDAALATSELKLVDKHCDWLAFKHAFNAVMKHRRAREARATEEKGHG